MAVLLTAGSTAAFAAEQTAPVVGDVNGDGAVDVMDATEIQRWLAETRESIDTKAADVNRDGAVDVQDRCEPRRRGGRAGHHTDPALHRGVYPEF